MQHKGTDPTRLTLTADATVEAGQGAGSLVRGAVRRPLADAAERALADGLAAGTGEGDLQAAYCAAGGDFIAALRFLHEVTAMGFVDRVLAVEDREVARLTQFGGAFDPQLPRLDQTVRLSRFALLRRDGPRLVAESPLGHARLGLGAGGLAALDPLTAGAPVADLGTAAGLDEPATRAFAGLLLNARVALPVDPETGATLEEAGPLSWWEFHDLLFHSRSRNGRFDAPYGGTYHRKGRDAPPAFLSPPPEAAPIPLPEPDAERLIATDPPFAAVMEARRSVRDYGDARLTIDQLGELLWRAARIRQRLATGPDDMDYSFRPHPGGGAIHELTLYPVVGACAGLQRGVYQYDPEAHVLRRMPVAEADLDHMLEVAWITGDRKSRPQVQFSITARAERMQWKYQSMVYAVILKNVGALYQTLYLAATAMGLAPTALGGGDSDRFARATGLDYYAESLVGEFLVGAKP